MVLLNNLLFYGGRAFYVPQLSNENVLELNNMGIGLRIPFTNHFANEEEYQNNKKFLSNYHHPLNSIICTNDNLASWIKRDFPDYDIEASVIKNISNIEQINEALEIYNTLVLPMSANDDDKLLNSIVIKVESDSLQMRGVLTLALLKYVTSTSLNSIKKGKAN